MIATRSGHIRVGVTKNVKNATNNLAELVAFTRALQWVRLSPRTAGKPVVMRYDSTYAAFIASGTWKAKKHREMAREARDAWLALKQTIGKRLWLRHAKGHSGHHYNDIADALATRGRHAGIDKHEDFD